MINVWKHFFVLVPIIAIVFMFSFYSIPHTELNYDQLYVTYQNMEPFIAPQNYAVREYAISLFGTNFSPLTLENHCFLHSELKNFSRTQIMSVPEITLRLESGSPKSLAYLEYSAVLSCGFYDSFLLISEMEKEGQYTEGFSILSFFKEGGIVLLTDFSMDFCRISRVDDVVNIEEVSYFKAKAAFSPFERVEFANNEDFFYWMLFKMGY